MPQFDFSTYVTQIFWLLVCFALLYLFTVLYSIPRMKRLLESRWQKTEGMRIEAQRLRKEGEELVQKIDQELIMVRQQSATKVSLMSHEIMLDLESRKHAIAHELNERYDEVERTMVHERSKAEGRIQELGKGLASQVIRKLLGRYASTEFSAPVSEPSNGHHVVNGD